MTMPTPDQTEGIWIGRTEEQGYYYVQDVFPGDTPRDAWHRANCRLLVARGLLQAERRNGRVPPPGEWVQTQRYMRVHI